MNTLQGQANLGKYEIAVETALSEMSQDKIVGRIWAHDHTVWKPTPAEITNRLGWLTIAERMKQDLGVIQEFAESVRRAGYTHALLLGMGGSSLAPEMFRKTFGVANGHLDLAVLDSTDPGYVLEYAHRLDPAHTLYIVATKSGGTIETLSGFKFFYNQASDALGEDHAGPHFVAITDPGSSLVALAQRHHFRETFLNDPNIGGRYSALSYFGLVPAALVGLNLETLLDRALAMADACGPNVPEQDNPGAWLGAALGEMAKAGRDKATFFASSQIASFGDWIEQLIAESTGKEGRGVLPVVGEPPGASETYGQDRVFVHLRLRGDETLGAELAALEAVGHPVIRIDLADEYDLGGQFFLWGIATLVAGHCLGINPFDQPNVEAAKVLAREMVATYSKTGELPSESPSLVGNGIAVYTPVSLTAKTPTDALRGFVDGAQKGAYIALQAYVHPTAETDKALLELRTYLRDRTRLATTVGYGPRFLHSTGQLHKGDAGLGRFIQITAEDIEDAPIPDEAGTPGSSMTFGVLKMAQALGDGGALRNAGRAVIRFHLGKDVIEGLRILQEGLR